MLLTYIAIIIFGLIAGGIVNLLADDLPHHRKPTLPKYPDGAARPPIAWLGLTAFLTGRRASPEGAKLSWRYPLTEIIIVLLMLLVVAISTDNPRISDTQMIFYLLYMAIFVLIGVTDIEHRLILFAVIIPSSILAILDAIITPLYDKPDLGQAIIGGLLGFGVFFVLYLGGIVFSVIVAKAQGYELPEVAFGFGDVMLSTFCGLLIGWQAMIFAMFITVFLGALGALIFLTIRSLSGRYDVFTPLPYGPYILVGTFIMLLFSDAVRNFLIGI